VRERVDEKHALFGDEKHRIRPIEVEKEIKVARDLLYLAGGTLLCSGRCDCKHDDGEQGERPNETPLKDHSRFVPCSRNHVHRRCPIVNFFLHRLA
jgi:hypothetical protein